MILIQLCFLRRKKRENKSWVAVEFNSDKFSDLFHHGASIATDKCKNLQSTETYTVKMYPLQVHLRQKFE